MDRQKLASSAVLALIGGVLVIGGVAMFLESLGLGGGYFATALILVGLGFLLVGLVKSITRAVH